MIDAWEYSIGKILKKSILMSSPKRCFCCKSLYDLTVHHIIPESQGGLDIDENKVIICRKCHDIIHDDRFISTNPNDKEYLERLFKLKMFMTLKKEFKLTLSTGVKE